jgi:hypothetical protein
MNLFDNILLNKKPLLWFFLHIILGVGAVLTKFVFVFYFYFIIISSFTIIFLQNDTVDNKYNYLLVYLISFEVFGRILNCSPWIPYEISKYLMFIFFIYGLVKIKIKIFIGFLLLIILLPALFYDSSSKVTFHNLIFNIFGPFSLCLSIFYFSNQKITISGLGNLIRVLLLPLVSVVTICLIRSPDFSNSDFVLGASKDFTGGFGSNQVSTIFGFGFFLVLVSLFNGLKISGYFYLDILLLCLFLFLGLLSFSRGGMYGGIFAFIIYIIKINFSSNKNLKSITYLNVNKYILPFLFLLIFVFFLSNSLTNGLLLQRYEGKTSGTILKGESVTLDKLTTGRFELFKSELELFQNNYLGVGAGASQFIRSIKQDTSTHTELGRLLSEHGILGLLFFLILLYYFFKQFFKSRSSNINCFLVSLFLIGIFTSFHAATRTYVSPLLIGLAFLKPISLKSNNRILSS